MTPTLPDEDEYWIAPNAVVVGNVILKKNASVWFGAVLRGDNEPIVIGENSNVQDNSVLHTDLGQPLTIGATSRWATWSCCMAATIGDGSLIGIGAIVLNGARIGRNCLIGAGALITEGKEIPDHSMVVGSPGKVVRQVSPEQAAGIAAGAPALRAKTGNASRRAAASLAPPAAPPGRLTINERRKRDPWPISTSSSNETDPSPPSP